DQRVDGAIRPGACANQGHADGGALRLLAVPHPRRGGNDAGDFDRERRHAARVSHRGDRRQRRGSQAGEGTGGGHLPAREARDLHFRVLAHVRRRAQLHARRDHRLGTGEAMRPIRRSWPWLLSFGVWTALAAQASWTQGLGRPGDPIAGITPAEFSLFRMGLDDFLEVETAEEGLGPAFNGTSCAACHNVPAIGGGGIITEVRAGRRDGEERGVGLDGPESTLLHLFSIPTHGCQPVLPADASLIDRRMPIPLFGAGLVEEIPDEDIEALADPDDRDRDGISGRAARVRDLATGAVRIGRFGWEAQHATLLTFGADAYRNEMGITNDVFPDE